MNETRKVLWIAEGYPPPPNVRLATHGQWDIQPIERREPLRRQLDRTALAVVYPNGASEDPERLAAMLREMEGSQAVVLVMLPRHAQQAWRDVAERHGQFICVPQDASPQELANHLSAAAWLQPAMQSLRDEITALRDASTGQSRQLEELDEQMRLAAHLQRDFLPHRLPEVGASRFGVLYKPATWVSGDIYDVVRLDETHVGFYVADVVGHGMPAALLTMFIKKALQTKRITGSTYEIIPPDESLLQLNEDLCDQGLDSCQFCTVLYCVLDTRSSTLTYARAGHPLPILVHPGGRCERLESEGGLMGIFPEATFPSATVQLDAGDRLLLFTDGAEDTLRSGHDDDPFETILGDLLLRPRDEMLMSLSERIDAATGSGQPQDDVTVVVMDLENGS